MPPELRGKPASCRSVDCHCRTWVAVYIFRNRHVTTAIRVRQQSFNGSLGSLAHAHGDQPNRTTTCMSPGRTRMRNKTRRRVMAQHIWGPNLSLCVTITGYQWPQRVNKGAALETSAWKSRYSAYDMVGIGVTPQPNPQVQLQACWGFKTASQHGIRQQSPRDPRILLASRFFPCAPPRGSLPGASEL